MVGTSTSASLGRKPRKRKAELVDLDGDRLPAEIRLRASRVTQKTLDQYHYQISLFHSWAAKQRIKVTTQNLDSKVVRYLTFLHEMEDAEPRVGAYLIYGLQLLRCTVPKNQFLPNAKEALTSWRKLRPGAMQLPVPEEILFDILMEVGRTRLDLMLLGLLQFDTCMRPGETLSLRKEHVVPPAGARYSKWSVIVKLSDMGERTKTGTADDSVVVGDTHDRKWMTRVIAHLYTSASDRLFPSVTLATFEKALAAASKKLRYSAVIVQPHVIRHSSASNDAFFKRRDLREIQKRGRWAARGSVSRYEKHGLMMRQWKFVAKDRLKHVQTATSRLVSFLNTRLNGINSRS